MRKRFKPEEKALLVNGKEIEVHYGSGHWVTCRVDDATIRTINYYYSNVATGIITGSKTTGGKKMTNMIVPGMGWTITPGNIRPVGSDWKTS
jgi:hypothetical protein